MTDGWERPYADRMRIWGVILVFVVACGDGSGSGWTSARGTPSVFAAIDVWAFSLTDVWVIDGSSSIQRYDGDGWSVLDSGSNGGLQCIFALSPTEVWLCSGGDLLFYDGATFETMNVSQPTGLSGLTDVWASSANEVWAVGDDAIVAHYDGNSWGRTIAGSPFKSSIRALGPAMSTRFRPSILCTTTIDLDRDRPRRRRRRRSSLGNQRERRLGDDG